MLPKAVLAFHPLLPKGALRNAFWPPHRARGSRKDSDKLRIPVKLITDSGVKPITDSGQTGHLSERSDAGLGL